MAEIFEIEDVPLGASNPAQSDQSQKDKVADKHLPAFDFDGYPNVPEEDDLSPRNIGVDDIWQKYEKQSQDETGATNLRHDPALLDRLISVLQMNATDVKGKDKKHTLQAGLRVLFNVLIHGKSEDPN